MPADTKEEELLAKVRAFNEDPRIHGLLVQLPLPKHINEHNVIDAIDPRKDVDGFHPVNVGKLVIGEEGLRPCTPSGIQELLIRSGNDPAGKHVVVVGRSNIVGKPIANILLQKQKGANATVTICHTGTKDMALALRAEAKAGALYGGRWDLVAAAEGGEVEVGTVPAADLPEALRSMSASQRAEYLRGVAAERERIRGQIADLASQRRRYLNEHGKAGAGNAGLSHLML